MFKFLSFILAAFFFQNNIALCAPGSSPELLARGKAAFQKNCVICHGDKGDGKGVAAAGLNPPPRDFTTGTFKQGGSPDQVFATIGKGIAGSAMAGFASLPEEDRWGLTYFVLSLKK